MSFTSYKVLLGIFALIGFGLIFFDRSTAQYFFGIWLAQLLSLTVDRFE